MDWQSEQYDTLRSTDEGLVLHVAQSRGSCMGSLRMMVRRMHYHNSMQAIGLTLSKPGHAPFHLWGVDHPEWCFANVDFVRIHFGGEEAGHIELDLSHSSALYASHLDPMERPKVLAQGMRSSMLTLRRISVM